MPVRPRHLLILSTLLAVSGGGEARAEVDRGVLSVEFLYAIESAGGRGERLREPLDLFVDRKTGEIYVVDPGLRKILVYDRNGIFLQAIPVDGPKGAARAAVVDGQGRLYVGHLNSAKVSVLDYRGAPLDTLSVPGVVDLPGAPVKLMSLAAGAAGEVYALKSSGGVVRLDADGGAHETIALAGDEQPNAMFGMAVDPGGRFLFTDVRPSSVVVFDPKTRASRRFGKSGVLHGQLDRPNGITTDDAGHVFVVSLVTAKVSCFGPDGEFIEDFGSIGEGYGEFYMPTKIASDGKDRIYVLENAHKRVQVFRVGFPKEKTSSRAPAADAPGVPAASP